MTAQGSLTHAENRRPVQSRLPLRGSPSWRCLPPQPPLLPMKVTARPGGAGLPSRHPARTGSVLRPHDAHGPRSEQGTPSIRVETGFRASNTAGPSPEPARSDL